LATIGARQVVGGGGATQRPFLRAMPGGHRGSSTFTTGGRVMIGATSGAISLAGCAMATQSSLFVMVTVAPVPTVTVCAGA
jgi:hypothetical protein